MLPFRRRRASRGVDDGDHPNSELPGPRGNEREPSWREKPSGSLVKGLEFRGSSANTIDRVVAPALLFVCGLLPRIARISHPSHIVFDEAHFVYFALNYLAGRYFFDIHPPLAKLVYALVAHLAGVRPDPNVPVERSLPFHTNAYIYMRGTSAVFGAAEVPLMFLLCRSLNLSRIVAITAALLPCFDHMLVIESRLILVNVQLMTWTVASIYCAVNLWKTPPPPVAPRRVRWAWLLATAVTATAAILCKWTAGVAPLLIVIGSLIGVHSISPPGRRPVLTLLECAAAGLVAIALYVGAFALHFALLPGTGDGEPFMKDEWKRARPSSSYYDPTATAPSFLSTFAYLHYAMVARSAGITSVHPHATHWNQWVANSRGLLYHHADVAKHVWERIYLLTNPFLAYAILVPIVIYTGMVVYRLIRRKQMLSPQRTRYFHLGGFFLAGYVLNLVPYIPVKRSEFIYHYAPSVFYGEILLAVSLDAIRRPSTRLKVCAAVAVCHVAAFAIWSAWVYGYPLSENTQKALRLLPRWD